MRNFAAPTGDKSTYQNHSKGATLKKRFKKDHALDMQVIKHEILCSQCGSQTVHKYWLMKPTKVNKHLIKYNKSSPTTLSFIYRQCHYALVHRCYLHYYRINIVGSSNNILSKMYLNGHDAKKVTQQS